MAEELRKGGQEPTRSVHVLEKPIERNALESFFTRPGLEAKLMLWGFRLLPWQKLVLKDCLSVHATGRLAYRVCGLTVPRQNGKTEIILARIILGCILFGETQKYTSYQGNSAGDIYMRLVKMILENSELRKSFPFVSDKNLDPRRLFIQAYDRKTGKKLGSCTFYTRQGKAGRGGTNDVVYFDEAQALTEEQDAAFAGTTSTLERGQLYYFGTASSMEDAGAVGRGATKDGNTYFLDLRARMLAHDNLYSCWNEWGVYKLTPKRDLDAIHRVNPSMGFRLMGPSGPTVFRPESLLAKPYSEEKFNTEHLGYWPQQSKERAIDITRWESLGVDRFPTATGKVRIGVALKSTIDDARIDMAVAVTSDHEKIFLQVKQSFDLNGPWTEELWTVLEPYIKSSACVQILVDGKFGQFEIQSLLQNRGAGRIVGRTYRHKKIFMVTSQDMTQASSQIITAVNERRVIHRNQALLNLAVEDAGKRISRATGEWQGFRSMSAKVDVNYLEVVALALLAVTRIKKRAGVADIDTESDNGTPEPALGKATKGLGMQVSFGTR